jgi:hypothetical protein
VTVSGVALFKYSLIAAVRSALGVKGGGICCDKAASVSGCCVVYVMQ